MARNACGVCDVGAAVSPLQRTEVFRLAKPATDFTVDIEQWHYDGVVGRGEEHHPYNAVAAHHAHLRPYAVGSTPVDGDEVVAAVQSCIDHLCADGLIVCGQAVTPGGVDGQCAQLLFEGDDLRLQPLVVGLQLAVGCLQVQVRRNTANGRVD